ncbi:hypothetical protein NF867_00390 [Solitalea sp. MAHUQ-68]|uniref:Uncharacterized protein n=1 Tax=Solitalea agri TaxID=2953739 RepID=A0A9X2F3Z6_9SPHI|nr:hypothetical protein [Solitalea agri]MCO4291318.1 hypothetical protein [Solitalea agri]
MNEVLEGSGSSGGGLSNSLLMRMAKLRKLGAGVDFGNGETRSFLDLGEKLIHEKAIAEFESNKRANDYILKTEQYDTNGELLYTTFNLVTDNAYEGVDINGLVNFTNALLGTTGLIASGVQIATYNEIGQTFRRTLNLADAYAAKKIFDGSFGKFSQKLGWAGVVVSGAALASKALTGQEIKTRDLVDFGVGVFFSAVTIVNPVFMVGVGIYAVADMSGALDGLKNEYLNQTIYN